MGPVPGAEAGQCDIVSLVCLKQEAGIVRSYDMSQAIIIPFEGFEDTMERRKISEKRAIWLEELQRIAREVSARAALAEDEAAALIDEAIEMTRGN